MEKLIGAYIDLAFLDVSNYKGEVRFVRLSVCRCRIISFHRWT
jgi:hypothetical protein